MATEKDSDTFLQVVMLASGIVRRIIAKRLDNDSTERLNKRTPEQCVETAHGEHKPLSGNGEKE